MWLSIKIMRNSHMQMEDSRQFRTVPGIRIGNAVADFPAATGSYEIAELPIRKRFRGLCRVLGISILIITNARGAVEA